MKSEVRPIGESDRHFQNVSLVIIEPNDNTMISISGACIEQIISDDDGNTLSQTYINMPDFIEYMKSR